MENIDIHGDMASLMDSFRPAEWLKGYTTEARFIASVKRESGWARGKGFVKQSISHWAKAHIFTMGDAQKGMVDALLDSVGC